jgi:para-aminobenzoate synthetase component 1
VNRTVFSFSAQDFPNLKSKIYRQASLEEFSLVLDSNSYPDKYGQYDWIAALGNYQLIPADSGFEDLRQFHNENKDWLFGHLSYELKNKVEKLESKKTDHLGFEDLSFFVPVTIIYEKDSKVSIESYGLKTIKDLQHYLGSEDTEVGTKSIKLKPKTSKAEYINKVNSLKEHIQYGNIYEVNYCIEFATEILDFYPLTAYRKLNQLGQAPFSAFYKQGLSYLLCSSPERYLQKSGRQIISQPIKGTIRRDKAADVDLHLQNQLYNHPKERSENVMIVDLVRNDLSRTAESNSVNVSELYGIYPFKTVHHMVSTINSKLDVKYDFVDVIKNSFPMGSMTGAPKVKAMELIEEHEDFNRGLYSGSVGYVSPNGGFDFNVVIRSLLYNEANHYLSARVGSAITIQCDAEKEYDECLLKARSLFKCLEI